MPNAELNFLSSVETVGGKRRIRVRKRKKATSLRGEKAVAVEECEVCQAIRGLSSNATARIFGVFHPSTVILSSRMHTQSVTQLQCRII